MKKVNQRTKYLVSSVLLHFLFLLLFVFLTGLGMFATDESLADLVNKDPLVFQLQEEQRRSELVETPDDAEVDEEQKDTDLASDKNARARNSEIKPDLESGEAFAEGEFEFKELPSNPTPLGQPGQLAEKERLAQEQTTDQKPKETDAEDYYIVDGTPKFSREVLTQSTTNPGANNDVPRIKYDNRNSNAPDLGSFSFNTYDWDFAPYMLALKKRVEKNIFPPPAFYRLGIIDGDTRLRFRIHPDGRMTNLEILDYNGHKTLMETSVRAIEISAPFMALPHDFPERYLEVTASFRYLISKLYRNRKG
ncbi:energy transducer TonB [bacterium]|nr:energy transducer TonB [bacterium]